MEKRQSFGMWKKQVKLKTGATAEVFNFTINGVRYTAWPNNKKSSEKSPDYNILVDTYEPNKSSNGSSGSRQAAPAPRNAPASTGYVPFTEENTELPF